MATKIEKGPFPQKQKGPGIILKTTATIVGGAATVGGVIGGMDVLSIGPFADSSPDQGNHENLPGGMPSATAMATQIIESPTPTEVPTVAPTPEPTPALGYHQGKDGTLTYATEKGEVLNVPQIEGLKAELKTENAQQKVVYTALEQNPYGMSAEQYAGEFKPNVNVEQKQTGGVVLKAPVVLKLIDDKLAIIPEQKDKWIITLPVDITAANTVDHILISFTKDNPVAGQVCKVSFNGSFPVVNIIPSSTSLEVLNGDQYTTYGGMYIDEERSAFNDKIISGKEMSYLTVAGDMNFPQDGNMPSHFGDLVTTAQSPVVIYLAAANEWRNADENKILDVGTNKTPVFLAATTP